MQQMLRSLLVLLCAAMLMPLALPGQTSTAPDVPTVTLLVPADGTSLPAGGISLFWAKPAGNFIDSYNVQLAQDSTFAMTVYDAQVFDTTIGFGTLAEGTYWWRVRAHDAIDDWGAYSPSWRFTMSSLSGVRSLTAPGAIAATIAPNPFSDAASLRFSIPESGRVMLTVTDAIGRMIATPLDGYMDAGEHTLRIDAAGWPAGVYLCRLATPSGTITQSMVSVQ